MLYGFPKAAEKLCDIGRIEGDIMHDVKWNPMKFHLKRSFLEMFLAHKYVILRCLFVFNRY